MSDVVSREPVTDAGRRLFSRLWAVGDYDDASKVIATVMTDILAIEDEARALPAPVAGELAEVALKFLRNWHLAARPDHDHDLVDDCPEVLFVRMREVLRVAALRAAPPREPLDVTVLAEALNATVGKFGWMRSDDPVADWLLNAEHVAAEYDRLRADPGSVRAGSGTDAGRDE